MTGVRRLIADGMEVHSRLHGALAMVLGEFAFTCRDLLGWDETDTFSLLSGTSTTSTEPARALSDVAALATSKVRALLTQAAPAHEVLAPQRWGADHRLRRRTVPPGDHRPRVSRPRRGRNQCGHRTAA
jgi:hypothetical protein